MRVYIVLSVECPEATKCWGRHQGDNNVTVALEKGLEGWPERTLKIERVLNEQGKVIYEPAAKPVTP